jgi:hypothetical protein
MVWLRAKLAPPLPPTLQEQLSKIEPGGSDRSKYFPCLVALKDGTTRDCVYVVSQATLTRDWGFYPKGERNISINDVASFRDSPSRLPAAFANKLYSAGESLMGSAIFTVVFSDGSTQAYSTGDMIDFISYPDGKSPADVVDVLPHVGRNATPQKGRHSYLCLYSDDETLRLLPTGLLEPRAVPGQRPGQWLRTRIRRLIRYPHTDI